MSHSSATSTSPTAALRSRLRSRWGAVCALALLAGPANALPEVQLVHLATLEDPLQVTHAGDGRLFIVERAGRIRIHTAAQGLSPTPFLDISSQVDTRGEGGLLSVAFHPDYASNGAFYVSYTRSGAGPPPLESVLARFEVSGGDPDLADSASERELLAVDQPLASHNGGQIAFRGSDGYLYAGFGDGGWDFLAGGDPDPECRAQIAADAAGDDAIHGALLRLDVDQSWSAPPYHGIPPDNPFASPADGVLDALWARGLRNPWRFSFDRSNGDLWLGDVGQSAREEIDFEAAGTPGGRNYGWKVMEGTTCFDPDPIDVDCPAATPSCFDGAFTPPRFEYVNLGWGSEGCSITGGFVYRGAAISGLEGHYVFGDFCGGIVWALEESGGVWSRTELARFGAPGETALGLTGFGEDVDGELYVTWNDEVYRIDPVVPVGPAVGPLGLGLLAFGLAAAGVRAMRRARSCR